ncbi:ParB/RepB/Spo0J family partition protein [Pseudomonas aeruginosa]
MSDAIAELLNSKSSDKEPRERIVLIHRSDLYPDPTQDRDDWETERTLAHIAGIRRSALIPLEDGRHFGIRKTLFVEPADEAGKHKIIDGECRWRATEDAPDDVQLLPCIIRKGGVRERRMDHVSGNVLGQGLTVWQTACSIKRDKDEFGFTTEEILAVHGIKDKSRLSRYMKVFKLSPEAQEFAKLDDFRDVNIIYDLEKLDKMGPDTLKKLSKRLDKGESIQTAIKALLPREEKKPAPKAPGVGQESVSDSETGSIQHPSSEDGAVATDSASTSDSTTKAAPSSGPVVSDSETDGSAALMLTPKRAQTLAVLLNIEPGQGDLGALIEALAHALDELAEK